MLKLILLSALASVGIAAPGPIGQLIYAAGFPIAQQANASLPEQKTIDAGYYANQYLGRIYGLFNFPNLSAQRQTSSPPQQPLVYTGYSAPLRYVGLPDILDYISYVARPWAQSNGQNNQGYGYGPGFIYHDDDDDDDDDDHRGGWGGPWGAWGGGDSHDHDNHNHDKPGSTSDSPAVNSPMSHRPNVVNQIFTQVA